MGGRSANASWTLRYTEDATADVVSRAANRPRLLCGRPSSRGQGTTGDDQSEEPGRLTGNARVQTPGKTGGRLLETETGGIGGGRPLGTETIGGIVEDARARNAAAVATAARAVTEIGTVQAAAAVTDGQGTQTWEDSP